MELKLTYIFMHLYVYTYLFRYLNMQLDRLRDQLHPPDAECACTVRMFSFIFQNRG